MQLHKLEACCMQNLHPCCVSQKKNLHPESIDAKQQYLYGQRTRDTMTNANKQYQVKDEKCHLISCSKSLQLIECSTASLLLGLALSHQRSHIPSRIITYRRTSYFRAILQNITVEYDHMLFIFSYSLSPFSQYYSRETNQTTNASPVKERAWLDVL